MRNPLAGMRLAYLKMKDAERGVRVFLVSPDRKLALLRELRSSEVITQDRPKFDAAEPFTFCQIEVLASAQVPDNEVWAVTPDKRLRVITIPPLKDLSRMESTQAS